MYTASFTMIINPGKKDFEKDCGADKDPKKDIFIKITELPMTVEPHGNEVVYHESTDENCCEF